MSSGKFSVKTLSKKIKRSLNREERRHQTNQIRQNKRNEVLSKKRSLGGFDAAPFLVCLLPLNKTVDREKVVESLTQCDPDAVIYRSETGVTHVGCLRFKQKFSFVCPPTDNELSVLDALKVADTAMFVVSASVGIDDAIDSLGQKLLMSSFSQGLPTPVVVVTHLDLIAQKKRHDYKQNIQKLITKWLPDEKLMALDNGSDGVNILRKIGNQKRRSVIYRDRRPHIYAESVEFISNATGPYGTLKLTGYLRGANLSVNGLVHLPGIGDFQMTQIDTAPEPYSLDTKRFV